MNIALLFSWSLMIASATETPIAPMDYANAADAAKHWEVSGSDAPLGVVRHKGRTVLAVRAPFAANPDLQRISVDRQVDLDLSAIGLFELDLQVDDPEAAGRISLYFHSGDGWFAAGQSARSKDWHTLRFSKAAFGLEDRPAGWHRIDAIRISAWHAGDRNTTVRFGGLRGVSHDVAVVLPLPEGAKQDGEVQSALKYAEAMVEMLNDLGLGSDAIDSASLTQGSLGRRKVAVLPYHPRLAPPAVEALIEFVQRGGKVLICYRLPQKLGEALGIRPGEYVSQKHPGYFAEMRFDAPEVAGLPETASQDSWNINTAAPAGHGARIIGTWHDQQGNPTGYPALLLSDRGTFCTHVLLSDDQTAKKQVLAAVLGHLAPSLWQQMSDTAIARAFPIGRCDDIAALSELVQRADRPAAKTALQEGKALLAQAQAEQAADRFPAAIEAAHAAQARMSEAYCRAQPSRSREGRAVWNHSGTGAYDGDWPRTARALAEAGFNMVIPNMLWAGVAHYESEVLPRSPIFAKHGDQIAQCVAACHEHDIEVHVWKVNFNLSRAPQKFVDELRAAGRTQVSPSGEPIDWLCPSHPENFKLELESMLEVARKYDVDGLHFDYIRYPGLKGCYCPGCRQRFSEQTGLTIQQWPDDVVTGPHREAYLDWRCRQISRLVEAVHGEAKQLEPELKISAAVFGHYPQCRESVGQDWVLWVRKGWLDFVCPMDYTQSDLQFANLVTLQCELVDGRIPLYPGIGAWRLTTDGVIGQIDLTRELGADGFTIFNLGSGDNTFLQAIELGAGTTPATPPHRD